MAEDKIIRGITDITNELTAIDGSIKAASEKKYYDETIGGVVKEAILEVLLKISSVEAGKNYYANELVETIKSSLTAIVEKVSNVTLDVSPILIIAENITAQNKEIINAILNIPKQEVTVNGESGHGELLYSIAKMIESNNEFIRAMMNQNKLEEKMEALLSAVNNKPERWDFKHNLDYGKIVSSTAIPKYKE